MIKINPECYPCFLRQVEVACRYGEFEEGTTLRCLRRAARYISGTDPCDIPAKVATRLHVIVRETGGVPDPFERVKREQKRRFRKLYSLAMEQIKSEKDHFETAIFLAGAANMFDYGLISGEDADGFFLNLDTSQRGIFEFTHFKEVLCSSTVVGLLLDNTGEAPFDLVLAEQLSGMGCEVWLGVKGGPVIDDITYRDALDLGLDKKFKIVSNGSQAVGTDLEDTSDEFREMIAESDLIISKGQANFETLFGRLEKGFFLFVSKCPVVERITGADFGKIMLIADRMGDEAHKGEGFSQF